MKKNELADLRRIAFDTSLPMSTRQQAHARYEVALEAAAEEALQWIRDMGNESGKDS